MISFGMGAASGNEACIATVVKNSVAAKNMAVLENGYGISLRRLAMFAKEAYTDCEDTYQASLRAISVIMLSWKGSLSNAIRSMKWTIGFF